MIDYYKVLQVDCDAEQEVIDGAYRRLAAKYHPDVNHAPGAAERMEEINAAYWILKDSERRDDYDQERIAQQYESEYSLNLESTEPEEYAKSPLIAWRLVIGVLLGLCVGAFVHLACQVGFEHCLNENKAEGWGLFYWGYHWIWRIISGLASVASGAALAAVVARKAGKEVGALVGLPASLAWAIVTYLSFTNMTGYSDIQSIIIHGANPLNASFLGNRIAAIILALGSIIIGYVVGESLSPLDTAIAQHFDRRRASALGVKWFHWLWLPIVVYVSLVTASFGIAYAGHFFVASLSNEGYGIGGVITGMLMLGWAYTVWFCGYGLSKAYLLLSDLDESDYNLTPLTVLKFGCGMPLLAVVCQGLLSLVQWGLSRIL